MCIASARVINTGSYQYYDGSTIPNGDNVQGVTHFVSGTCSELRHFSVGECLVKTWDCWDVQVEV